MSEFQELGCRLDGLEGVQPPAADLDLVTPLAGTHDSKLHISVHRDIQIVIK
jgi:hypothetical protein